MNHNDVLLRDMGDGIVRTTRVSASGRKGTMDLPADFNELKDWIEAGRDKPFVQDAFPHMTADQREFLLTGTTPEEWEEMFDPDNEAEE